MYAVIHQPTEKKYAAKVISKDRLKSSNLFNQILNEITIMETLDHPNIVRLETYFENDSNIYLILELGGVRLFVITGELVQSAAQGEEVPRSTSS